MNTHFTLHALHIKCSKFHLLAYCIYCYIKINKFKKPRFCPTLLSSVCKSPSTISMEKTKLLFYGKCFSSFVSSKIDRSEHTVMLIDWPLKPSSNRPNEWGQTNTQLYISRLYIYQKDNLEEAYEIYKHPSH